DRGDRCTVPEGIAFHTGRTGEGPLIWAQLAIWDVFRWLPPGDTTLNLLTTCPVEAEQNLDVVLRSLALLVERHALLLRVFLHSPAGPRQRVLGDGVVPLRVVELGDRTVDEATAEEGEALRSAWFDLAADLPLRVGVLTRDGAPQAVLLAA